MCTDSCACIEVADSSSSSSLSSSDSDSEPEVKPEITPQPKATNAVLLKAVVPPEPQNLASKAVTQFPETLEQPKKAKKQKKENAKPQPAVAELAQLSPKAEEPEAMPVPAPVIKAPTPPMTAKDKEREAFTNWYLRTLTTQYANDLDKLRTAPDFRGDKASVEVLRSALKCGVGIFYDDEA